MTEGIGQRVEVHLLSHRDDGGSTWAAVVPAWGANVVALSFQAPQWAWPVPVLERMDLATVASRPTSFGMPILAPTPGRVGRNQSGVCIYRGREYRLAPSRHGFVRDLAWEVSRREAGDMTCVVEVRSRGPEPGPYGYPFHFRAEHEIRLSRGALRSRVRFQNTGRRVQPLNVGWHPYLRRSAECTVCIPATGRWELDGLPEPTPTGRILPVEGRDDFRQGRSLGPGDHWDDVFTDLIAAGDSVRCWVEEPTVVLTKEGSQERCRLRRYVEIPAVGGRERRKIPNVQLYTPPGRQAISLEPLSTPPDALNLLARGHQRAEVCQLAPGEGALFEMILGIEVLAD